MSGRATAGMSVLVVAVGLMCPDADPRAWAQPLGGFGSLPYEFFSPMVPSNFLMACSTLRSFAIFFPTAVCSALVPPVWAARALDDVDDVFELWYAAHPDAQGLEVFDGE